MSDQPQQSIHGTDKEIWREKPDDYYSPSIHVTGDGRIGISVNGLVIEKSIRWWHHSGQEELDRQKIDYLDGEGFSNKIAEKINESEGDYCISNSDVKELIRTIYRADIEIEAMILNGYATDSNCKRLAKKALEYLRK